jgi:Zn-dependent peptidase ImmA (M78 family)
MSKGTLNPDIMVWARTTAGLSPEEASRAIGLKDANGLTGAERLAALEGGEAEPSHALLLKMAKEYRRPLLAFYLPKPPQTADRGQDFRTVPGAAPPLFDPDLDALIRDIRARQSIVKSLQEDLEAEAVPFVGAANMRMPVKQLAGRVAESMDFVLKEYRSRKSVDRAFSYLRSRMEDSGVFVLLLGNLGSHHTNIPVDTCRGFAIADPIAPFVVVNDHDAKSAQAFTALHELVHLWLGTTGISGASDAAAIERYCNEVAGEILLPAGELAGLSRIAGGALSEVKSAITAFAEGRHVSRAMVAYKAFRIGLLSEQIWSRLTAEFKREWMDNKAKQAAKEKQQKGGPSYYVVSRYKLGPALLGLVGNSLRGGVITYTKAGQVLGVKPRNVDPLLRETGVGS